MSTCNVIGIDLGTTFSCASVFKNGKIEVVPNSDGDRTTPSVVAFTPTDRLVGRLAENQLARNARNTIFNVKRLIGRKLHEPEVAEDLANFPFRVRTEDSKILIDVEYRHILFSFTPEEISAMILQKLKIAAELFLDAKVTDAVITVPAYFNDGQRQATRDAATIAGLKAIRIINEPTAAVLACGIEIGFFKKRNVLVFDLGGGTFDISIVTIKKGPVYKVISTDGNTHLGGIDFDQTLVQYFINQFEENHGKNISDNQLCVEKLRIECEKAKRSLSTAKETMFEFWIDGEMYLEKVTRAQFEYLCADLFAIIFDTLKKTLMEAQLDKSQIDDVLLVGGSTRIPRIQNMLRNFFPESELKQCVNPDEVVANGAAIQAAICSSMEDISIRNCKLHDVTPMSLRAAVVNEFSTVFITRNQQIPTSVKKIFTTVVDNQTCVRIEVLEGEKLLARENNLLGELILTDITPMPRKQPRIEVKFEIDVNGILHIEAEEVLNHTLFGRKKRVSIKSETGRLDVFEIAQMAARVGWLDESEIAEHELKFQDTMSSWDRSSAKLMVKRNTKKPRNG